MIGIDLPVDISVTIVIVTEIDTIDEYDMTDIGAIFAAGFLTFDNPNGAKRRMRIMVTFTL